VRVPTWVWVVLGVLAAALVTIGLLREARDASTKAQAAKASSATQLMNWLVAGVATTNQELSTFNKQFEEQPDVERDRELAAAEREGASPTGELVHAARWR
jgi:hypothetical protein